MGLIMLKIELKRGFKRNTFLISLTIGIIICLGELLINSQFYIKRILDPSFCSQAYSLNFMKGYVRSPMSLLLYLFLVKCQIYSLF